MTRRKNEKVQENRKGERRGDLSKDELRVVIDDPEAIEYSFDELLDVFIEDCEYRNLREHTIKYYKSELTTFKKILYDQGLEVSPYNITNEVIKRNVIMYMRDKGVKAVSINSRLRALRSFFNLLESQSYIKVNPMKDIKLLKDRKRIVETFDKKQIKALFNACDFRTFVGVRDHTAMMLLLETGVRANEFVGIKVTDIIWAQKLIRITNTKGGYERFVPIQKKMIDQLKKYVIIRGQIDTDYLFITQDDEPMSKRQLQNRINHYGKLTKIKNVRCSPHTFRHTFAKLSVMNGANAFQLQAILGHSTLEVTKVYVNLFSSEVQEGHAKFSPLKNL
ncbi:tyrosine-type recombinase/integrase [Aquibacillus rhizosphaerae]|uniref:Tyrosine-type recombinase/integrase n=1 Tax=Aquibacillus rhizosphaerae TaxID=3051431 RepID=A0ABT7L3A5_9BACI|nr:tyrosine-type recombinase/integrase [Aquibacillus sp. LR5S19]MDL4840324.1 tyrosine-type recombinase/integrase [Aquibacillus sp. LR5S19]